MPSGGATLIPGKVFDEEAGELVTLAKLNQLGNPVVRVDEGAIGARELDADSVRTIVPSVNRNLLINGNFDVWQRGGFAGASFVGLPTVMGAGAGRDMGADRWYIGDPSGTNKRNVYQGAFTMGQSDVPNEPTYYLRWSELVGETGEYRPALSQQIEDVRTLAGKSAAVSWWMKGNVSANITCGLTQIFDGFNSPKFPPDRVIAADSGGTAALISGAVWTQYVAKFTIPSLAGISGDIKSSLTLWFQLPDNVTFLIDFAQIQLEEGAAATTFETLPLLETHRRCERYFEYHPGLAQDDITHGGPCYYFATRKYRPPTLSLVPGYSGTMTAANFATLLDTCYYQSTANSAVSVFYMACEAEIGMP